MSSPLRTSVITILSTHYEAFDSLAILHGDVSGGNVLIYPKFLQGNDGWVLRLTDILPDWEMARPASTTRAEALGTMSVARLSLVKPVEVCDELESFYYLLLYCAVRYLRSYSLVDGHQVCGWRKLHTIATGHLAMAHTKLTTRSGVTSCANKNSVPRLPLLRVLQSQRSWSNLDQESSHRLACRGPSSDSPNRPRTTASSTRWLLPTMTC
ncbi:hypothetical protein OH76DRAFT_433627 [Lentinus brumalis]|uniref:Fungal-type protein kinase domain-containing protein n=1 Tax=Lentinus brumalis TaxID=2498619 RepID=A0A371DDR7_9APHY|nr:hypothetical protein OH76DRAFT_433627 [Polyporus brumalis]